MKKVLRKKMKPTTNAVRYFTAEQSTSQTTQWAARSNVNGHATQCAVGCSTTCQMG